MPSIDPLVSIGLPVRNGQQRIESVVRSVLAQDHADLELVISDNASTDGTEQLCRDLAATDPRIRYIRQPENIGLLNNFITAMRLARGRYFRWISDEDALAPTYLSRCLAAFAGDPRLILVTTKVAFIGDDGAARTAEYNETRLADDDPVVRLTEMLRLLNASHLLIDPLYGLLRRDAVAPIPRRNMLCEDQIFAAKLALAGPWSHVPEVLAERRWRYEPRSVLARRLDTPTWQARAATLLQCRELLAWIDDGAALDPAARRRARAAVYRFYLARHQRTVARRGRRLAGIAARLAVPRRSAGVPPG